VVQSKIIQYDRNRCEFQKLLEFRYNSYVKELQYLAPKPEFELLQMEFDEYDLSSEHIVLEKDSEIIACARIIRNRQFGLPILNKLPISDESLLFDRSNVEVSRMIVKQEYRSTSVFVNLLQTIFERLLFSGASYVLADTFVNSDSYMLLISLGFKKADLDYKDESFNLDVESTLLYFDMSEMKYALTKHPNKGQRAFLRNIRYQIAGAEK
jgi:predicted GNAT family N-acyltransferase